MNRTDLLRLAKLEDRINQIATEDLGLELIPCAWDVIPAEKMIEIQGYRSPVQISNWKFGRDMERGRTIYDNVSDHLPYEVIIYSAPLRAYLMNTNPFAIQALIVAHCIGHNAMFTMSKWFQNNRSDMLDVLYNASERFNEYERLYGIDAVEQIVDAGHALQWHCNPFETETELERKKRVYEQRKMIAKTGYSAYGDLVTNKSKPENIEEHNKQLWATIKSQSPIEPVEDILRYVIDNSTILDDWQRDILEILRIEGQYYWPIIRTKTIHEGLATLCHTIILNKLFNEGLLTNDEYGQCNYSNSLVKAKNPIGFNPYLVGSGMFEDILDRWDRGKHGYQWEQCTDAEQKRNWNTNDNKGWEKIREIVRSYTDWFFMQDFLTEDLIDSLDLYIYVIQETYGSYDYIRTKHTATEVKEMIINSFAHSGVPRIDVLQGNYNDNGSLYLMHRFAGAPLERGYAIETMKHIHRLWGRPILLETKQGNKDIVLKVEKESKTGIQLMEDGTAPSLLVQNNYVNLI